MTDTERILPFSHQGIHVEEPMELEAENHPTDAFPRILATVPCSVHGDREIDFVLGCEQNG